MSWDHSVHIPQAWAFQFLDHHWETDVSLEQLGEWEPKFQQIIICLLPSAGSKSRRWISRNIFWAHWNQMYFTVWCVTELLVLEFNRIKSKQSHGIIGLEGIRVPWYKAKAANFGCFLADICQPALKSSVGMHKTSVKFSCCSWPFHYKMFLMMWPESFLNFILLLLQTHKIALCMSERLLSRLSSVCSAKIPLFQYFTLIHNS